MTDGKKREPPLALDMDFDEAMRRFARTDKREVDDAIQRGKQKKPPEPEKKSKAPTAKPRQKATPSSRSGKRSTD